MKNLMSVLFILVAITSQTSFGTHSAPNEQQAIGAYEAETSVILRQAELKKERLSGGDPRAMLLSSVCGFVGCQTSFLVAQNFIHLADGPSRTILAMVTYTEPQPGQARPLVRIVRLVQDLE